MFLEQWLWLEAGNASSAPGPAQQSFAGAVLRIQCIALDLIVQRKEKRQSEGNANPEFLRGCHWCNQHPEPAVQSEVLGAQGSAGHHLGHRGSLGTAWLRLLHIQDWRLTLGRAPRVPLHPKLPPGQAFPACFCTQNL